MSRLAVRPAGPAHRGARRCRDVVPAGGGMKNKPALSGRVVAYLVTSKCGRQTVAYACDHSTARCRAAKDLGLNRSDIERCVRSPQHDDQVPSDEELAVYRSRAPFHISKMEANNPGHRFCTKCDRLLLKSAFVSSGNKRTRSRECRACRAARWQALTPEQRAAQLISTARHRARQKGLPFDLCISDISIPSNCPVLGIPLAFSRTEERHNSPSLDRIIPEHGYVRGNVIVVSWRANDIRRNFPACDLIAVGKFYGALLDEGSKR